MASAGVAERGAQARREDRLERSERSFRRNITAALVAGLVAMVMLAGASLWLYQRERDYSAWVDHTYSAEAQVAGIATLVEQLETARRGYLLAPRANYWATYLDTRGRLGPAVDAFSAFTIDNSTQQRLVSDLRALLALKQAQLRETIELAYGNGAQQPGDLEAARRNFVAGQERHVTERMRVKLAAMAQEERGLLAGRADAEQHSAAELLGASLAMVALLAVLGTASVALVRRYSASLQRTQGALRKLNLGLEDAVRERTLDLTRANEEIQRFAYIVSHDLRSPLVNIMGFTSELEAATPALHRLMEAAERIDPAIVSKEARELVELEMPEAIGFIRKSTQKMDRLINAILRLSREGRRNLTVEPLDVTALVGGVAATLRQLADSRDAQVTVEGVLPDLQGDRVALEQVFSNLMENALKYLKPGRPGRVVVRGRVSGGRLVYEVEDNGRGIDPRDHERIFDLFRRSGSQDQPGEGIGLAHVRALVYRLGGVIDCQSELDQGATFRVSLPRQHAQQ